MAFTVAGNWDIIGRRAGLWGERAKDPNVYIWVRTQNGSRWLTEHHADISRSPDTLWPPGISRSPNWPGDCRVEICLRLPNFRHDVLPQLTSSETVLVAPLPPLPGNHCNFLPCPNSISTSSQPIPASHSPTSQPTLLQLSRLNIKCSNSIMVITR
jgi:hypothetical protein